MTAIKEIPQKESEDMTLNSNISSEVILIEDLQHIISELVNKIIV